jgi:DNA-binding transcriptional LysR family regulator
MIASAFVFPSSGRLETWRFVEDGAELNIDVNGRLIFPDNASIGAAALSGLGLAQRFGQQVERDLAEGRLVQVLAPYAVTLPGFYIYYPSREHLPLKLRVFIDFLRENLGRNGG